MAKRVCPEPGCPVLVGAGRCAEHRRAREQARGSSTARGYGYRHRELREVYQQRMDAGERFRCWRCTRPIDAGAWHLGHDDHDRSRYRGPECVPCNTATAARRS